MLVLGLMTSIGAAQNPPQRGTAPGQPAVKKSPLVPFAGNWVGTFEGKPWMLLNLNLVGEEFSGVLQRTRTFDLNDNGQLKHVSDDFVTYPLAQAELNPDGLVLTFKDINTQQTQRYLLKLTGETTAEIRMIEMTMPPGYPKPKPWKLTKAAAPAKSAPAH